MADLDRAGYELILDEQFDAGELNEGLWLPYHLPHWASRARSLARFRLPGAGLELLIEADQPPWYAEIGEWTRVSTLQTGEFAGPIGSAVGQYRLKPELVVVEEQPNVALFTTQYGLIECRARAMGDEANSVALWLIGYEDEPERSAEICVFEIFGRHIGDLETKVGMGIHPHGDPSIHEDFSREPVAIDARQPHTYSARWTPTDVSFYVDERLVKVIEQSPQYPMQLMLSAFEFVDGPELASLADAYPKVFAVDRLRIWHARPY